MLTGNERNDFAGLALDAADMDGDGCVEVAAAEPWEWWGSPYEYDIPGVHSAVHLLQDPWTGSGLLRDHAFATFRGAGGDDGWGEDVALLTGAGQLFTSGRRVDVENWYHPVGVAYDLPVARRDGPVPPTELVGALGELSGLDDSLNYYSNSMTDCPLPDGRAALCVLGARSDAAEILVIDAPLDLDTDLDHPRARYYADLGANVREVHGRDDVNGDGRPDLLAPVLFGEQVAVVLDRPDGLHRLWDLAAASITFDEDASGTELGRALDVGDLDGDGHPDVWLSDPIGTSQAWVVPGPFAGEHPVEAAPWRFTGSPPLDRFGLEGAFADLDGDGATDLAIAAPGSLYFDTGPGEVLVWYAPPVGPHDRDTADLILTSGSGDSDCFGFALEAGDLDGDGLDDLVVGAPRDAGAALDAGSVTLIFAASLP